MQADVAEAAEEESHDPGVSQGAEKAEPAEDNRRASQGLQQNQREGRATAEGEIRTIRQSGRPEHLPANQHDHADRGEAVRQDDGDAVGEGGNDLPVAERPVGAGQVHAAVSACTRPGRRRRVSRPR